VDWQRLKTAGNGQILDERGDFAINWQRVFFTWQPLLAMARSGECLVVYELSKTIPGMMRVDRH
jgi:hypothetical protein